MVRTVGSYASRSRHPIPPLAFNSIGEPAINEIVRIEMPISRIVVLLTCLLALGILGCGDSEEERKTQALNVAQSWAEESTVNTELVIAES